MFYRILNARKKSAIGIEAKVKYDDIDDHNNITNGQPGIFTDTNRKYFRAINNGTPTNGEANARTQEKSPKYGY